MKKIKLLSVLLILATITSLFCIFPVGAEVESNNEVVALRLETTYDVGMTVAGKYADGVAVSDRAMLIWTNKEDAEAKNVANATVLTNGTEITNVPVSATETITATCFTINISAKYFGDTHYFAACTLTEGVVNESSISTVKSSSVAKYAHTLLGNMPGYAATTEENLPELLTAILNYGAAAQTYKNYKTDALVNDFNALFPDAAAVNEAVKALDLQNSYDADFTLPLADEANGTTNAWVVTGDTAAVSIADDGNVTVTRQAADATVTFTATVSKGEYSATKSFTVTIPKTGAVVYEYKLVTDASTLSAGDQLVIVCNTKNMVACNISGTNTYLSNTSVTISSDKSTIAELPEGALVLTLGGETGAWTFANTDGNLLGATAAKNVAWGKGTTTWSISIDASGNAEITNGKSSYGSLKYNASSPRFTTYLSTSNQTAVQIYVRTVKN